MELLPKPHLDVACGADIHANMTPDAARIIRINVTANGVVFFLDLEHRNLRAIDDAVVALEAHAAAHTPATFVNCLLFGQTLRSFFKIVQDLIACNVFLLSFAAFFVSEMSQKQLVAGDNMCGRAIFVIVQGEFG